MRMSAPEPHSARSAWSRVVALPIALTVAVSVIVLAFLWPALTSEPRDLPLVAAGPEAQVTALLRRSAVSGVVQHEGEDAFVRLHECSSWDRQSLGEIPHLCYRIGDEVAVNRHAGNRVPLTATRPHGLDPQYVAQAVELPVIVGRGCFYHCSFCDYRTPCLASRKGYDLDRFMRDENIIPYRTEPKVPVEGDQWISS